MRRAILVVAGTLLLSACGGSQPAAETPPSGETPAGEAEGPLPTKPFDDLSQEERFTVMKKVVVPTMKPLFQAQDSKKFAEFGCVTCHGPHAKEGKFVMPNPDLPKLNFADNMKGHKEKTPEMLQFMIDKVSPGMAEALKLPHFDPATGKGFGCLNCHTKAE